VTKLTEYLKYEFSDEEITAAAKDLARATQQRTSLEQRKKEVDSALKADIEAQNSIVARLSTYITTGYEYRDIEVRIELDVPETGKKTMYRCDTGEEVKVQPMTDMDRQMRLELEEAAKKEDLKAEESKAPIVTRPPAPLRLDAAPPVAEVIQETVGGPSLVPAALMGGTHQKGTRGRRGARNPEQEAYAAGGPAEGEEEPEPAQ
jgi:hypothetical protein